MNHLEKNIKEIFISRYQNVKNVAFLIKEMLFENEVINVISSTSAASISMKATENLSRLGYINYVDVNTNTSIINSRRKTRLIITVKKTFNYERLYRENLDKREKLIEENEQYYPY